MSLFIEVVEMEDIDFVSAPLSKLVGDFCKSILRANRYAQVSGGHDRQGAIVYLVNKDKAVFEIGAWKHGGCNITVVNSPYREIVVSKGGRLILVHLVGHVSDAESAVKMFIKEARACTVWTGEPPRSEWNSER